MSDLEHAIRHSRAWPCREACRLLDRRLKGEIPDKGYALFETGYGPSGLPHIGTFAEVARTTMVQQVFAALAPEIPTKLFCFSDDMDGLRKVPENIPNREMIREHLGKPLTSIPDPFGTHESFGHHNNARLRSFLDEFGFQYEFKSSTECYRRGIFDDALLAVLENYDRIAGVILPTLGAERRATYSPFLPVSPRTGRVLQAPVSERNVDAGTIVFTDEDGTETELPVTGGHCKLQWKCDWAMRWYALQVDYEMSGKDLIDSLRLSGKICRILGGNPPNNLTYEMFLDENGEKISKSKGNGLAVEEWLKYAPPESLSLFMYKKPTSAKRLYFDVIPRNVDEYLQHCSGFSGQDDKQRLSNPVWHIHGGSPPRLKNGEVTFSMLLNLVSVCHSDDPEIIWHYVTRYAPGITPQESPMLDCLIKHVIRYFRDFVLPEKKFRKPNEEEKTVLQDLRDTLAEMPEDAPARDIQSAIYRIGKAQDCFGSLREWFKALYQILLGQDSGPRMGSFVALYGLEETVALIDRTIAGEEPV